MFALLPNLIHMKGLCGFPNHRLSCRKLLKSLGVSMQKISIVNNKKEGNLNVSNLFFTVNCFFPSFSPFSLFLAVEDNVTEDQNSPGQTAIPSGNAPFHISSFSAGKWIMCLCVCVCVKSLLGSERYEVCTSCFWGFHTVNCMAACVFVRDGQSGGAPFLCLCVCVHAYMQVCLKPSLCFCVFLPFFFYTLCFPTLCMM